MAAALVQPRMTCFRADREGQVSPANLEGRPAMSAALAAMTRDDCLILRWARGFNLEDEIDHGPGECVMLLGSAEGGEPLENRVTSFSYTWQRLNHFP